MQLKMLKSYDILYFCYLNIKDTNRGLIKFRLRQSNYRAGNQTLNKNVKDQIKKRKKQNARSEKKISQITDVLDGFSLETSTDDKYDFNEDYTIHSEQ